MENNKEGGSGKWGMVVDLDRCTGCGACVTACAIENNLPAVGEEENILGRGMHWMRIQRYWEGEYPNVKVRYIPLMCQQCGAAPCEPVCPVFATYHTVSEEINIQVYNRCVGTRFCAQNCPYIARVFNWFDYPQPETFSNYFNPDVTRRMRGVMEKCNFCFQRIRRATEDADLIGKEINDGELQTACSQVCPTNALIFGDLSDPQSHVSRLSKSARGIHLLEDLGTLPRVYYLLGSEVGPRQFDS
jgi:molybdopterin-containing oxidoreductase family iron-sulfur binding subunit